MPRISTLAVTVTVTGLLLAACDQVRLPGDEPQPASEVTEVKSVEPAPEVETADPAPQTDVQEVADIPETAEPEEAPIGAEGFPQSPLDAETLDLVLELPETEDLAAVNAALCGLGVQPLDNSMTLAELTGAEPSDPNLVGTATINGAVASLMDYPGLVKMEPREFLDSGAVASGHCGATRIAERWFLTAAHCLDEDYDEVSLVIESETLSSPLAKRINAVASVCHGAYGGAGNNFINDIALVRVAEDAVAELDRVPIANYGATEKALVPYHYGQAQMAGWGLTSFQSTLSDTLLSASLSLEAVGPAALNFASQDGAGPCVGDSGGPAFVAEVDGSQTVIGVLSVVQPNLETGRFCEGDYIARYTNVQGYESWIDGVIEACENGLGLCGF